jgi:hypothetical protein
VRERKTRIGREKRRAVQQRYGIGAAVLREIVRRQIVWDALLDEVIYRNVTNVLELCIDRKEFGGTDGEKECFAGTCRTWLGTMPGSWLDIQRKLRAPWLRSLAHLRSTNAPIRPPRKVPGETVERVLQLDKTNQYKRHRHIAQAVGLSQATVSRILDVRKQLRYVCQVPDGFAEVIEAARVEGARRFRVGWVSGPTLEELKRSYVRRRYPRLWGR